MQVVWMSNRIIYFDPWNTLAAKSRDDIRAGVVA